MNFHQFKKAYRGTGETRNPNPGETITRCTTMLKWQNIEGALPACFTEISEVRHRNFRVAWESPREWAIVTFCEGDVTIQTFDSQDGFRAGLADAIQHYRRKAS